MASLRGEAPKTQSFGPSSYTALFGPIPILAFWWASSIFNQRKITFYSDLHVNIVKHKYQRYDLTGNRFNELKWHWGFLQARVSEGEEFYTDPNCIKTKDKGRHVEICRQSINVKITREQIFQIKINPEKSNWISASLKPRLTYSQG